MSSSMYKKPVNLLLKKNELFNEKSLPQRYWNNCTKTKANCNYLPLFVFRVQRYKYFLKQSNFQRIFKLYYHGSFI